MSTKTYFMVYLREDIEHQQWSHLHRFIHPGSRHDPGWKSMFCSDLDLTGCFLHCRVKDYTGGGPKNLHMDYGLVASILEVGSHNNPLGFVNPEEYLESQEAQE